MTTRREFMKTASAAVAAAGAWSCSGGDPTGLGGSGNVTGEFRATLPAVGATVVISGAGLGGQGIAVSRLSDTSVVAVSLQCTHQGCTANAPSSSSGVIFCPCHGSAFTTSGSVVNGPASSPLRSYPARIDGAQVVVTAS